MNFKSKGISISKLRIVFNQKRNIKVILPEINEQKNNPLIKGLFYYAIKNILLKLYVKCILVKRSYKRPFYLQRNKSYTG